MEPRPAIEDERGVDLSQIRALLRMTIPERVAEMVRAANVMLAIRQAAGISVQRQGR